MYKTGNIQKNIDNLKSLLKEISYPDKPENNVLKSGNPEIYLPIIHYTLFNFSPAVAKFLSDNNYDMFAKNDLDFINSSFTCLIKLFNYKPSMNSKQFFSVGFAEGKVILCCDIINLVKAKHSQLSRPIKKPYHVPLPKKNTQDRERYKNNTVLNNQNPSDSPKFKNEIVPQENPEPHLLEDNAEEEEEYFHDEIQNPPLKEEEPIIIGAGIQNNLNNNNNLRNNDDFVASREHLEVFDSSQDFPYGGKSVFDSNQGSNANTVNASTQQIQQQNTLQSSRPSLNPGGAIDFSTLVKVISSLSNSVTQMANKIENFKSNVENRLNKVEAEISLIKNRQNIIEAKINTSNENFGNRLNESNEQVFSFACDYGNQNDNCMNESFKETFERDKKIYNNTYSFSTPSGNIHEDTDKLIKNVEKQFSETKKLLSQF